MKKSNNCNRNTQTNLKNKNLKLLNNFHLNNNPQKDYHKSHFILKQIQKDYHKSHFILKQQKNLNNNHQKEHHKIHFILN